MLSQNAPFSPIHDAWVTQAQALPSVDSAAAVERIARLGAFVLGNQAPPYGIAGGVREALVESVGRTYAITNEQLGNAMSLFAELEGVGIEPAAGVATAALSIAVARGDVDRASNVLLHVTGGGRALRRRDAVTRSAPALVLARGDLQTTAVDRTRALVR
jgi:cysteate synthase